MVIEGYRDFPKAYRRPERLKEDHLHKRKGKKLPSLEQITSRGKTIYFSGGNNDHFLLPKRKPVLYSNKFNILNFCNDDFDDNIFVNYDDKINNPKGKISYEYINNDN